MVSQWRPQVMIWSFEGLWRAEANKAQRKPDRTEACLWTGQSISDQEKFGHTGLTLVTVPDYFSNFDYAILCASAAMLKAATHAV